MQGVSKALFLVCLSLVSTVFAQPSGGPYGPVMRSYEVPADASQVIYVSPVGDTNAPGERPGAETTLEAAMRRVRSGAVVVLRGGVYRTGGLVVNQGVTLQAYQSETPVLKGTQVAEKWTKQKNGLWRCAWAKLFPQKPADWWRRESVGAKTPLHRFNNDMVFVDGRALQSAGWEGELDAGKYYIDYEAGQVYLGFDPNGHEVEITVQDSALVRTLAEVNGVKSDGRGFVIRGVSFTQYAYRALEVECREAEGLEDESRYGKDVTDTLLENVSITHCSRVAAYLRGDRTVVRNCLFSDTSTEGLYLISSSDCLLERNIFGRNNVEHIEGYFPSAVKIFNQSHRVVCRDNLVLEQPESNGIWYDVGNRDGVFVNNHVRGVQAGFFFEISKGALCAGNVFVDCEKGVYVLNSERVQVRNNTFVNSQLVIERTERSAAADHFGWHPSTGPDVEERVGHVVVGNLLYAAPGQEKPLVEVKQPAAMDARLTVQPVCEMEYNQYVREERGGTMRGALIAWAPLTTPERRAVFVDLKGFGEALGTFEKQGRYISLGRGGLFVSRELGDFRQQPGLLGGIPAEAMSPEAARWMGATVRTKEIRPGAFWLRD